MNKKNCAIITFNQAINYGAVLQMYALQKTLLSLDCNCEVINYNSKQLQLIYKPLTISEIFVPRRIGSILFKNSYINFNHKGFDNFIKRYIRITEQQYDTSEQLIELNIKYDFFITGSDQVFNLYCSGFDENYLLAFVKDNKKKNSYAASLGLSEIPIELRDTYKNLLMNYNYISVREKTGANALNMLLGRKCDVNVDPSLLLYSKDWCTLEEKPHQISKTSPYILVYVLSEDKKLLKFAKRLKKKYNYPIYYINDRLFGRIGMTSLKQINPEEWLWLIHHSEFVVTNSFHGIAFSINYEKNLFPFLLDKNARVNSRIIDLLSLFQLQDILVDGNKVDEKIYERKIDYNNAKDIQRKEYKKAIHYLEKIIKSY